MEQLCKFYRQLRILGVECGDVRICQFCIFMCVNGYINTRLLLGQKVQRFHINIPVNQDNLLCRLLGQVSKQSESIINLSVKKQLLVLFFMVADIFKNLFKLLVCFQLLEFYFADPV